MRYDGYNGDIEATETDITIIREGLVARTAFGKTEPRVIPLAAVAGVRLEPAGRFKNGHIQLLLAGRDAPPLTVTTAASNADAVVFTHKHNDEFARLAEWLQQVADHNHATGQLAAAAELTESAGQQGRLDKFAQKAGEKADALAARAEQMKASAEEKQEQLRSAKEQREAEKQAARQAKEAPRSQQAAAAAPQDEGPFIDWSRFRHLRWDGDGLSINFDDEDPGQLDLALQEVKLAKKQLATERRELVQAIGQVRAAHRDKQANRMPAIRGGGKTGQFLRAAQSVSKAADRRATQNTVSPIEDAKFALDRIVTALDELALHLQQSGAKTTRSSAPRAAAPAAPVNVADELTKLAALRDQGILTEDEFTAQKTKLLGS